MSKIYAYTEYSLYNTKELEDFIRFYESNKERVFLEYFYNFDNDGTKALSVSDIAFGISYEIDIEPSILEETRNYSFYEQDRDFDSFEVTDKEIEDLKDSSMKTIKLIKELLKLDKKFKELLQMNKNKQ